MTLNITCVKKEGNKEFLNDKKPVGIAPLGQQKFPTIL